MLRFAWLNLLTRPLRTALALIGLSIPILGVLGLFSLSGGMRSLVGDTLGQIQGLMVVRENALSPVFSDLPANLESSIKSVPGVRVVAPEVIKLSPLVEGRGIIQKTIKGAFTHSREQTFMSLLDQPIVQGQDIPAHHSLRSAVFPSKMLKQGGGRFLSLEDRGKLHVVVSRKIAEDYPIVDNGKKRVRRVGDPIGIGNRTFTIIGLYETGSMFLDVMMIMDIETARSLLGVAPSTVSCFYVEADDPARIDDVSDAIETKVSNVDARGMQEFTANFGRIMGQLDQFLLMVVSLALVVGVVGIINTMLMSTTERFVEFGVLRTNGWSKRHVLALVTAESACLGLLAGLVGCFLAWIATLLANPFIGGGLHLSIPLAQLALGIALSVVMGTLGGLYPAWRRLQSRAYGGDSDGIEVRIGGTEEFKMQDSKIH